MFMYVLDALIILVVKGQKLKMEENEIKIKRITPKGKPYNMSIARVFKRNIYNEYAI